MTNNQSDIGIIHNKVISESLQNHWDVNESPESFQALLYHIEHKTNFKGYFEEAIEKVEQNLENQSVVSDIGVGVGWTSALIGKKKGVQKVYAYEISEFRRSRIPYVLEHFNTPPEKIVYGSGTFREMNMPEPCDLIVMCGSFHHCDDADLPWLFNNLRKGLKPGGKGKILLANEHYVDNIWFFKRLAALFKAKLLQKQVAYTFGRLNTPDPYDGEQWRELSTLKKIFNDNGFSYEIYEHSGDLCKDKPNWYSAMGWHYYHAVLTPL